MKMPDQIGFVPTQMIGKKPIHKEIDAKHLFEGMRD
jgi:hypothetical protein